MPLVKTDGIVLRTTDFSETSQVVALCTRDCGQVHLLAKGSRRPRKDGRGPFDLLTKCDVVFIKRPRGGLYTATDWSVMRTYRRLREDLDCLYAAMHACELVLATTHEADGDDGVFGPMEGLLDALDRGEEPAESRLRFGVALLRAIGLAPCVDVCSQCGRGLDSRPRFSARSGGAVCNSCGGVDASSCAVSRGALAVLSRLMASSQQGGTGVVVSAEQRREIDRALKEHWEYQIGRALRTAKYVIGVDSRSQNPERAT